MTEIMRAGTQDMSLRVVQKVANEEWMMTKLAFAIMAAMLGLSAAASAQPGPGAEMRQACAADAQKFCSGMAPAEQRKCLMSNMSSVSQECGTAIANARSAAKEFQQACRADIQQYCGSQPAGLQRRQCVTANQAQFSQACQSAMAARHGGGTAPPQQ
jgi:hypothetical protein